MSNRTLHISLASAPDVGGEQQLSAEDSFLRRLTSHAAAVRNSS